jgi:hypothetical protein
VRERGGSRLGRASPVKPTRVDLTSGPRLSADFILFKITKKTLKNPNQIKTTSEKYPKITKNRK